MSIKTLLQYEDCWPTSIGAWLPDEGRTIYQGQDLFRDLKRCSWMKLLLLGITGRQFDERAVKLFEAMWVISVSYPEPRLWPNRVAALAGSARSTGVMGVSAALAASEGTLVGHRANIQAIEFFLCTRKALDEGASLEEWVKAEMKRDRGAGRTRGIPGYGRLVNPQTDERIRPMMEVAHELGFGDGAYVKLALQVEQALTEGRWRRKMNIGGLIAALAADQGLTPRQYYSYLILSFSAGIVPCYVDALKKPEGAFFPLRCQRIRYDGAAERRRWDSQD
jgi:citrate synthase